MTKYIFVTGGVVSSLGKGIASASLAAILESRGLKVTLVKLDPYINVDPGTMSPYQHGEVFVTADGSETDLDLGNYERFTHAHIGKDNNMTSGQIYERVIKKERRGDYLGATVQVIPHISDEIKESIKRGAKNADVAIIEVGGTVGDIESLPFLEAIRQMGAELGPTNTAFVHLTLVPYISTAGELKTKPTQHSVKELRSIGIAPDILICRSKEPLPQSERRKISLFTNVSEESVISSVDVPTIYQVPIALAQQNLDKILCDKLQLKTKDADLSLWQAICEKQLGAKQTVSIGMVGKYVHLTDAYKSVNEALVHAGIANDVKVHIEYIDPEQLKDSGKSTFSKLDGILVPGGFGERGSEGKIAAITFARENKVPFLGICLGMQLAVVEFARVVAGLADANSTEFDIDTKNPVIALVSQWQTKDGAIETRTGDDDLGGTMRLGAQECNLVDGSFSHAAYGQSTISERHRHRYEVNGELIGKLEQLGLRVAGRAPDGLVEIVEHPDHPWFVGCQFHPEFTSKPLEPQPLFRDFVKHCKELKANR